MEIWLNVYSGYSKLINTLTLAQVTINLFFYSQLNLRHVSRKKKTNFLLIVFNSISLPAWEQFCFAEIEPKTRYPNEDNEAP